MKNKICIPGVLLLCCVLLLCACGESGNTVIYNGRELSEDEIQSMLYRETERETKAEGTLTAYGDNPDAPDGDSVYWTAGGSVFHAALSCRHLSGKKVYYGTVEDAVSEGKLRTCSACFKK